MLETFSQKMYTVLQPFIGKGQALILNQSKKMARRQINWQDFDF